MATEAKKYEEEEKEYAYYPSYYVSNGKPFEETAQLMVIYLDWCKKHGYTPYITVNYGKPGGGGGCPPQGCG